MISKSNKWRIALWSLVVIAAIPVALQYFPDSPNTAEEEIVSFTMGNYDGTAVLQSSRLNLIFEGTSIEEAQVSGLMGNQPDYQRSFIRCGGPGCTQEFYLEASKDRKSISPRVTQPEAGAGYAYVPEKYGAKLWVGGQLVKIERNQLAFNGQKIKFPSQGSLTLVLKKNGESSKTDKETRAFAPVKKCQDCHSGSEAVSPFPFDVTRIDAWERYSSNPSNHAQAREWMESAIEHLEKKTMPPEPFVTHLKPEEVKTLIIYLKKAHAKLAH